MGVVGTSLSMLNLLHFMFKNLVLCLLMSLHANLQFAEAICERFGSMVCWLAWPGVIACCA